MNRVTAGCPGGKDLVPAEKGFQMTDERIADKIAAEHSLTRVESKAVIEAVFPPSRPPQRPVRKSPSPALASLR
jgi:hypothetical protein